MYMKVLPRTALLNIDETKDLFVKSESQARLRKHLGQNKSHHLHILVPFRVFRCLRNPKICVICAICVRLNEFVQFVFTSTDSHVYSPLLSIHQA